MEKQNGEIQENKNSIELTFGEITHKNMGQLKVLNAVIFPVKYNDKFYSGLLHSVEFSKLVYHTDILVGAVCCRMEAAESDKKEIPPQQLYTPTSHRLYIMTLGVLAPYRRYGIGGKLLNFVLELAKTRSSIEEIYLHVQTNNEEAINFYKRFGFEIVKTIPNYYQRIVPPDCYVVAKKKLQK